MWKVPDKKLGESASGRSGPVFGSSKPLFGDSLNVGLVNNINGERASKGLFSKSGEEASKPIFRADRFGEAFNNKNGETSKPLFGESLFKNKNGETSKPLFGGDSFSESLFKNKNDETSKPLFGGDSLSESLFKNKNDGTSKPLFGGGKLGESLFNKSGDGASKALFSGGSPGESLFNKSAEEASKPLFGGTGDFLPTFTFEALSFENTNDSKKVKLSNNPNASASPLIEKRFFKQLLSLVYKCTACGLCFDRLQIISQHLNYCLPLKKITRIHCVCGLEFDTNNYKYHCEVHREFNALKKKDVTIVNDVTVDIEGMAKKFMRDTKQGTVSAAEDKKVKPTANDKPVSKVVKFMPKKNNKACTVYRCKCKLCFEKLELLFNHLNKCDPDEKITRVLCMCGLEFDMDNYSHHCEVHRKFAILHVKKVTVKDDILIHISAMKTEFAENDEKIAKSIQDAQVQTEINEPSIKPITERSFQRTFEQLLGLKIISAVIDTAKIGKENQAKITIIIESETEKAEGPNKTNTDYKDNEVAEILKSKTTTCPPDDTNGKTERDPEGSIQEVSDIAPNENAAPTKPENKSVNSSNPVDSKTNEISEQIEQFNIDDHQRNSDTRTNETFAEAPIAANKPESTDIGSHENNKLIDGHNINNDQENSDIVANENSAATPTDPSNIPTDNPESTDLGSHKNTTEIDGYNKITNDQEKSKKLTSETAVTPPVPANKAIDRDTTQIDGYKIQENNASFEPENKAKGGLEPLEDKVMDITTKHNNEDNSKLYTLW